MLDEARRIRARLRAVHRLETAGRGDGTTTPRSIATRSVRMAIAADPRVVHVARKRGRDVAFSNGGTELELARESAVQNARDVEAVVVFDYARVRRGASDAPPRHVRDAGPAGGDRARAGARRGSSRVGARSSRVAWSRRSSASTPSA